MHLGGPRYPFGSHIRRSDGGFLCLILLQRPMVLDTHCRSLLIALLPHRLGGTHSVLCLRTSRARRVVALRHSGTQALIRIDDIDHACPKSNVRHHLLYHISTGYGSIAMYQRSLCPQTTPLCALVAATCEPSTRTHRIIVPSRRRPSPPFLSHPSTIVSCLVRPLIMRTINGHRSS